MDIYFENVNQAHVHMVLHHSEDKPENQNPKRAADSREGVGIWATIWEPLGTGMSP